MCHFLQKIYFVFLLKQINVSFFTIVLFCIPPEIIKYAISYNSLILYSC
jgi:hypothetical protein